MGRYNNIRDQWYHTGCGCANCRSTMSMLQNWRFVAVKSQYSVVFDERIRGFIKVCNTYPTFNTIHIHMYNISFFS